MGLEVKWSERAEREFDEILNYWNEANGSNLYSLKLIDLMNKSIIKLSQYPESGRSTDNLFIRYKIVKDYFLYYSFDKTILNIEVI